MDRLKIKRAFQHEVNGGQLKEACRSLHFFKIPGKESISNPRLLPGIYTLRKIMATDEEGVSVFPAKSRLSIDCKAKANKC